MSDDLISAEKEQALLDALSDEGTRRCFAHCGEPDCECDAAARQVAWAAMTLAQNGERLARTVIAQAAEITRLRAQVEQFRDTNRRMNRRLQLLEGWWQRRVDRARSERALLFSMWCRDRNTTHPNLKAIEEAAYQRGYADGFDAKFFIPKRATYQQKREGGE